MAEGKRDYSRLFPDLFVGFCRLWAYIVAPGALLMVLTVWILLMAEDINTFTEHLHHYLGNDGARYGPDLNAGYVTGTNIPKHLGSVVFVALFEVSIMIFILVSLCGDLFWRFEVAKNALIAIFAIGLWSDDKLTKIEYTFLAANSFLKVFICAATGAQSWANLNPNNPQLHTPRFALYATFILLGTTIITPFMLVNVIQRIKKAEYVEDGKKAALAKASKSPV